MWDILELIIYINTDQSEDGSCIWAFNTELYNTTCILMSGPLLNSLRPSDAYIYASVIYPSLVQKMAWRLVGAKPLSEHAEPMLYYCQLDP